MPAIQAAIGAYLLGQILVLGWFALAWNAWRRIGGASPARAIVAFALFVAFAVPCVLLLAAAQHGAELPLF